MQHPASESLAPAEGALNDSWSHSDLSRVSGVIGALGHPLRLSIITLLSEGERSVSDLCDHLWTSQPNISHHLSILQSRNLVTSRKEYSRMFYTLTDKRLSTVAHMIATHHAQRVNGTPNLSNSNDG